MSSSGEQLPIEPAPRPWPLSPEPEPVFGLLTVGLTFLATLLAVVFMGGVALVVAHRVPAFSQLGMTELSNEPLVLIPAQMAAYGMVLLLLWRFFTRHCGMEFFRALSWNRPARWPLFFVAGIALAVVVDLSAHFLPAPPELPVDKMLRTPTDAWLLSVFGVLIAPFFEEILFRGLLFPALARRTGALLSLVATSVLFGVVHEPQLAHAWFQVAFIMAVSMVLTGIRWRFRSLAASTLVHVGYNATLFGALMVQTHGFTRFPVK